MGNSGRQRSCETEFRDQAKPMSSKVDEASPRLRGRPKDAAKREAVLDAARDLLLAHGADVTMDGIAAKAGVAKATLYANFSDKGALAAAVLSREVERSFVFDDKAGAPDASFQDALIAFGVRYLTFINGQQVSRWNSLIASSGDKHSELPPKLFAAGPGRLQALLADLIEQGRARGEIIVDDSAELAGNLTGLWLGFEGLKISLLAREPYDDAEIRNRAIKGVRLFLRLYGTELKAC